MHIEIKDNTKKSTICDRDDLWSDKEFFVATVGEEAADYLSGRIFSLQELTYCSPITIVNVNCFSEYKRWNDNSNRALRRMEEDTQILAKSCSNKQLYILSEVEDQYTADQCFELASNAGANGLSILITHKKIKEHPYFSHIRRGFDHIVFLPDDATYTTEILRWLICGFGPTSYIGVDYNDALYVLAHSTESDCLKIKYNSKSAMKKEFEHFLKQIPIADDNDIEIPNQLLGVWVPRNFYLEDVTWLYHEILEISQGGIVITCLPNENDEDESWTVSLLTADTKQE